MKRMFIGAAILVVSALGITASSADSGSSPAPSPLPPCHVVVYINVQTGASYTCECNYGQACDPQGVPHCEGQYTVLCSVPPSSSPTDAAAFSAWLLANAK
jgi:hypothetical protein